MTCIVALEFEGMVYMGGDSAAVGAWVVQPISHPKVFILGDFIIGYTSSFRMGQLLEYNLIVPENNEDGELKYLVTKFIPAIRECLKEGGFTKIENNKEEGGTFLIGYRGKVYLIDDDFQITGNLDGFSSVGTGKEFALGALAALDEIDPQRKIKKVLEIAGRFSIGARPPYYVLSK